MLSSQNTLSVKDQKKDFKQLIDLLEAHPTPYLWTSEDSINRRISFIKQQLDVERTNIEFYKLVAPLVSSLKDGHSSILMPQQYLKDKKKEHGVFPYEVYLSNDDILYALKPLGTDSSLPLGSKITKINDLAIPDILESIDPLVSYERKAFRNAVIQERFDSYLTLQFGKFDSLELTYATSKDTAIVTVENMPHKEWKRAYRDLESEKNDRMMKGTPYSYTKLEEGLGLLNIHGFLAKSINKYDLFLRKTFKKIKEDQIQYLIIDLRGNYGGSPIISSRLLHYITEKQFKNFAMTKFKISKWFRNYIKENYEFFKYNYIAVQIPDGMMDINAALRNEIGSYKTEEAILIEEPKKKDTEFTGKVLVLTDRRSFSMASSFASTVQCFQLGHVIGEETGGTKVFSANAFPEILSNSRLTTSMSTTQIFASCYYDKKGGVRPDFPVEPTILDIKNNSDPSMNFARLLVRKLRRAEVEAKN